MKNILSVTVRNKTEVFVNVDCKSLSLNNDLGDFDILPEHTNFVSIFSGEIVIDLDGKKTWRNRCVRGVVRAVENVVDVVILED